MVIWCRAKRRMISMLSPARRFFSISTRSDRSVVWTDTLMGEMRQVDDALHLPLGEVGQGQVVAHQKGQPGVVILEIEALPHPRRHLVHKAEDAVVGTGAGPVP